MKKKISIVILIICLLGIIVLEMYLTDRIRMKKNKPVLFSTWGYSYVPPINLPEQEINSAILNFIVDRGNNEIKQDSASSIPYKFVVENVGGKFIVTDSKIPKDGIYYPEDMKSIFPSSVRNDMDRIHTDGTTDRLQADIQKQKELYFYKY